MYVCVCYAVTDHEVRDAVHSGCHTPEAVADATNATTACGSCTDRVCGLVTATRATAAVSQIEDAVSVA